MPAITTTLVFSIGPAVAKALLSQLLKDKPVLGDLAPDLLDWLKDKAKAERRDAAQQISAIGETVAAQLLRSITDENGENKLSDNDLVAVLHEFIATLDEANVDAARLIDARLDRVRLARGMLRARPEATKLLSAGGAALYERLVREASNHLTAIAAEFAGYASLRDAALLQDNERLCEAVLTVLRRPDEESARFETRYREVIQRELNKLELFGVRRLTVAAKRQKLNVAYVTVEVDRVIHVAADQRDDVTLLRQLLDETVHSSDRHEASERRASPIDTVLASQRRIIIRGEAGSGKTTLLQWIAVNAATPDGFSGALHLWNNTVPFFIRLRQVAEQGFPAPEQYIGLIAPHVAGSRPRNGWEHELENGRAVLLIDGVDELPKGKREAFLEQLKDLVRDFPHARYLITSRPAAVNERAWPEWNEWTEEEGFAEVAIQPMSNTAVDEFIDHWHRAYAAGTADQDEQDDIRRTPTHLKKLLPQRTGLRRLASNPLLCAMICALHHEKRHQLPSERIKLYEECIDMLLAQRDAGRGISQADYPDLGTKQKQALLQDLAFRMMRGGESKLPVETVEAQFEGYLPRLGLEADLTSRMRAYFVERSSILREPVQGQIDFAHRTFQEFFTAQAIAKGGELGFLQRNLHDDQWQETVVLSAGLLQTKQSERLVRGLLAKVQAPAKTAAAKSRRRRMRTLALACLETALDIDPALRQQVFEAAQELFPPYAPESQRAVAAAGEHAIPYLTCDRQPNIAAKVVCIHTLAQIGGEKALTAIESYKDVDHELVREAINAAWPSFDHREYALRLLKDRRAIQITDASLLPMLTELPQLHTLNLSNTPVSVLSGLAQLPQLHTLDLSYTPVSVLSGLAQLPQLHTLVLSDTQVSDLSGLAQLPQLQQLDLRSTQVSDLSVLAQLPNLERLVL